jgi:hypothetical protein
MPMRGVRSPRLLVHFDQPQVSIGFRMKGSLDQPPPTFASAISALPESSIWFYLQDEYVTNAALGLNST